MFIDYLSEQFRERAYADPKFRDAVNIVSMNSRGRVWVIGGFLYKTLIRAVHGTEVASKDFDFVVERARERLKLPDGWTSRTNRFGNPELSAAENQVDLVPLDNILYLRKMNLAPSIRNYLASVNFDIFALAFDLRDEAIVDGGGVSALERKVLRVHNLVMAEISAEIYGKSVNEMISSRAREIGFDAELV